jgi:hypothetical protein
MLRSGVRQITAHFGKHFNRDRIIFQRPSLQGCGAFQNVEKADGTRTLRL